MTQPGRPQKHQDDARERLLIAARRCFTKEPYSAVTTRMLAKEAGVNAALIRYYFINKEGLYKEMFIAVTGEVMSGIESALSSQTTFELEDVFRIFYGVMQKNPTFPLLMFRELILKEGTCREFLLDAMLRSRTPFFIQVLQKLRNQGVLDEELDERLLSLNLMSMLIFPWYMREMLHQEMNIELDGAMLEAMARHNARVLKFGCYKERGNNED